MSRNFYITTTLPYVNADPHIGFALEILQADVLARYYRKEGREVFFNTGTDEHGQKIKEAADKNNQSVQEYVDHYADQFNKLKDALDLSYDAFIRTTDDKHISAAQEMWRRCEKDIYKKEFEGLYCVGCERFLTARDIVDGKCVIHGTEPQFLKEENWFFNFKKYEQQLLSYLSNPKVVIPDWRREEAINFVKDGLEDFSISRDKKRLSWGVPVPGDDTQVMYVWFDALTSYISTLDWPNGDNFHKFWEEGETVQMAGKDQVRFQSLMFQAMLMSADIKNTDEIFYHGFINSGGQKMSKSLGNVISPYDLVTKYGTDATRYLLLRHVHSTEDTDVTWERLDEWFSANLANGIGNLASRIMTMAEKNIETSVDIPDRSSYPDFESNIREFEFQKALNVLWHHISEADRKIQETEPFKLVKADKEAGVKIITELVRELARIATMLEGVMPSTAHVISEAIKENKKPENLFPRLS
jgi:methionyl-tRNA synthetase